MNFSELMKKPLPSSTNAVMESEEDLVSSIDDNDELDPIDDMDDVLTISDDISDDTCDDDDYDENCGKNCMEDSDENPEIPVASTVDTVDADDFTPDEDQAINDTMDTVGTAVLLKNELNSEDAVKEFTESMDYDMAVAEGFMTERTIVRFDKKARKAQLYEVAVRACAREKHDPLYKKLMTIEKMKRVIEAKLRVKYNAPAQKKVKEYILRAQKSKSGVLAKIIKKITGK